MNNYSRLKILIVEDDEDDYILLRELLIEAIGEVDTICWAEDFKSAQVKISNENGKLSGLIHHSSLSTRCCFFVDALKNS